MFRYHYSYLSISWADDGYSYIAISKAEIDTIIDLKVKYRDTTIQRMTIRWMLIERHFWLHCWLSDFIK